MPFAQINHNTSGNNEIVAAVPGKKIRVLGGCVSAATTVVARFEDAADSGVYLASFQLVAGSQATLPYVRNDVGGCFETSAGNALNLELGGAVVVSGFVRFDLVGPGS